MGRCYREVYVRNNVEQEGTVTTWEGGEAAIFSYIPLFIQMKHEWVND